MKVTYLFHSGFAVELKQHVLIFDYYKGKLPDFSDDKEIMVFASHKHPDHFDFCIFKLAEKYKHIRFFLGNDIRFSDGYLEKRGVTKEVREKIEIMAKNRTYTVADDSGEVIIETLKSTDAGVAFIVSAEGQTIYHAGDLNWWQWDGEDPAWNRQMEKDYKQEIDRIEGRYFDAAFVPLDPRLEKSAFLGMQYFMDHTKAERVFPMHMWEKYGVIDLFVDSDEGKKYKDRVMKIKESGQEFIWGMD